MIYYGRVLLYAKGFLEAPFDIDVFLSALGKDKKNVGKAFKLIIPDQHCIPEPVLQENTPLFRANLQEYISTNLQA